MARNKRQFKLESLESRELLSFVANPGNGNNVNHEKDNLNAYYSSIYIGNGDPDEFFPPSVSNQAKEAPGNRADQVHALLGH